jgi:PAS domain S-box-containing protein
MNILAKAIEQSVESVVITDITGKIEYVNPAFEIISGYSSAEALGKNPRVLKSGRQSREFYKELWYTITDGGTWHGEFINKRKDGTLYNEEATISPIRGEMGVITHFVAIKNDVTRQKMAQEALIVKNKELELISGDEHSYSNLMELFNSVNDEHFLGRVFSLIAAEQHYPVSAFYEFNESSGELGCIASHGIAEPVKTSFRMGEGMVGQAAAERQLHCLSQDDCDIAFTITNGIAAIKPAVIIACPITFQEELMGVLVLASTKALTDLRSNFLRKLAIQLGIALHSIGQLNTLKLLTTQLQAKNDEVLRQNELLEAANRTKSEFLSNMSHELRTPLNAIIGFSEALKDGVLGGLAEDQKSYMTDIFDSGQHLLSLINEILDLAKIEEGKMTLDLEPVDIRSALENCLSVVRGQATERHISLKLTVAADIGPVILDDRKFRQIVLNLLSNAVKFTPEGGSVSTQARLMKNGEDLLEIAVTDTGIGMTGEDMKKLFRPFEQLDGSIGRKYGGTGLGLAIVKKIAKLHGGTVTVASEPGQGSVFTVLLPCIIVERQ